MNAIKQKLVFNEILNELRNTFRNQLITSIEDLSNEILYEIFDYFDGGEIVKTFSKLNSRFEQLLYSSSILIKTHFYLFYYEKMINKDHELEIFSNKLCSNLKILFINCSENIILLDAHRWEQFISYYYPKLEKFYFTYYYHIDINKQYEIYSERINQFFSTFWIERKWIFNIKIDNEDIKYIIYPYKKRWYDYIDDNNIEYSTSTSLILTNFIIPSYDEIIFEQIKRIITIQQIYHLNIEKSIFLGVLIQLVNKLPFLITLKLDSLSYKGKIKLNYRDFSRIVTIKNPIKITKVYIKQINVINDFYNIATVCPRMVYFETKYINNIDIQSFLRNIFNTNNDHSNCLRSLIFDIPTTNDEIIKNFDTIIRSEK
ncbi:unnamed protein product [Rotaria sordida]|uniref:F-box domain-containing protein n=1 Tax=Rotaria sordida TaxID=392033 RepID=A0A815LU24_9BILA|nr:unnamed protein product [Rotaria sordida]CAF4009459.1 unnamed protein product [Rotaria sordida]